MSNSDQELENLIRGIASKAREASLILATTATEIKNRALEELADLIEASAEILQKENQKDLEAGKENGLTSALLERLTLTPTRIKGMAEGVRQVAALPDPVGQELERTIRENKLDIRKIRVPIGVIGIIYESRPNVTIDCAVLCLKSGNASILRGGKEAFHTNTALAALITQILKKNNLDGAVQLVPTTDRAVLNTLLKLDDMIQCIIPRGGEGLIRFVAENSTIPVIKHFKGVCNVYVDKAADHDMAEKIVVDAKCDRPSVCNAAENFLIHKDIASELLPKIARALIDKGVELRADTEAATILSQNDLPYREATDADWEEEYLELILAVKVADSLTDAIDGINTFGSAHSDAIITNDENAASEFLNGVDSATVYWNASTRFTDGFEFGLGAEIGISTDKLHARGPMGLNELCSYKYIIYGNGQTRSK
ncbi:MAG: glutamate-5-semialdehyde dehydrogenase [Opitutaceae bacterium]|nr:glutamate-5-semialdehyde dehydrogenase [Opitutaceae bacterium]